MIIISVGEPDAGSRAFLEGAGTKAVAGKIKL